MTETDSLNLLEVDPDRAGEEVRVRSTQEHVGLTVEIDGYVDEDGIVRQESNGASFNADVYEVVE